MDFRARCRQLSDRAFLKLFASLVLPLAAQQFIGNLFYTVDNIMIGRLGQDALAAVALAGQLAVITNALIYAISSAASILGSRYFGAGDREGIRSSQALSLVLSFAAGIPAMAVALLLPEAFLRLYAPDEAVLELAAGYLRIVSPTCLLSCVSSTFSSINKAAGRMRLPLLTSAAANGVNVILNYGLIYGRLGMPAMGVRGAALATLAGSTIGCAVMITFSYLLRTPAAAPHFRLPGRAFTKIYLGAALPILLNDGLWCCCGALMYLVYGRMGAAAVAAVSIAASVEQITYIFLMSVVSGTGILIGQSAGRGDREETMLCAKRTMALTLVVSLAVGAAVAASCRLFASFYSVPEETRRTAAVLVFITGIALPARSLGINGVVGILRPAGDTAWAARMEVACAWAFSLGLTALTGLVLGMPVQAVFACSFAEDLPKFLFALRRIRSGRWFHPVVRTDQVTGSG